MGPIGCPETLVRNYPYSVCNDPEERSSYLYLFPCEMAAKLKVFPKQQ